MIRVLVLVAFVGATFSSASAETSSETKKLGLAPRRSACEMRLLKDANIIKTRSKNLIRQYEDILDEQLDLEGKLIRDEHAKNMVDEAHLMLNEIRRMQMGEHGRGLLERHCKKSVLSKPVRYN